MPLVPSRIQDLLEFAEMHAPVWTANATSIGLTTAQAAAFTAATSAARDAYTAHQEAVEAARVAAATGAESVRALRRSAGDTIRLIRAFAQNQTKPLVIYNLAQIPAPATPSPMPPPGTPFDFNAALNTDGSITIRWRSKNPVGSTGTVYNIRRRIGTTGDFTLIGAVGERKFTDSTLPAGAAVAQYVVTGQRGDSVGSASSPFVVMFGGGGTGLAATEIAAQFSQSAESAPSAPKLAAA